MRSSGVGELGDFCTCHRNLPRLMCLRTVYSGKVALTVGASMRLIAVLIAAIALGWSEPSVGQHTNGFPESLFLSDRSFSVTKSWNRAYLPDAWRNAIEEAWRRTRSESREFGVCLYRRQGFSATIQGGDTRSVTLFCDKDVVGRVHTHRDNPKGEVKPLHSLTDLKATLKLFREGESYSGVRSTSGLAFVIQSSDGPPNCENLLVDSLVDFYLLMISGRGGDKKYNTYLLDRNVLLKCGAITYHSEDGNELVIDLAGYYPWINSDGSYPEEHEVYKTSTVKTFLKAILKIRGLYSGLLSAEYDPKADALFKSHFGTSYYQTNRQALRRAISSVFTVGVSWMARKPGGIVHDFTYLAGDYGLIDATPVSRNDEYPEIAIIGGSMYRAKNFDGYDHLDATIDGLYEYHVSFSNFYLAGRFVTKSGEMIKVINYPCSAKLTYACERPFPNPDNAIFPIVFP